MDHYGWLNANGWEEWPVASHDSHDRQWFRKYPGEPMCATNEPKPLQLRVKVWDHRKHGADAIGLEVELHAEPIGDGGWVVIKAHAFGGVEEIPNQVERLLVGWRAICSSCRGHEDTLSRSQQKRIAVQNDKPVPDFSDAASKSTNRTES